MGINARHVSALAGQLILLLGAVSDVAAQTVVRATEDFEAEAVQVSRNEGKGCGFRVVGVLRKLENGWEGVDFNFNLISDRSPPPSIPPAFGYINLRLIDVIRGRREATEVKPSQAWVRRADSDQVPTPLLVDTRENNKGYLSYYLSHADGELLMVGLLSGKELVVGVQREGDQALRTYSAPLQVSDVGRSSTVACLEKLGLMRFQYRWDPPR